MSLAPVLMVQGTSSSAGKSTLVAGLCRLFARRGVRVAPFKAQNMSNNAAVCSDGAEIGRAQFAQAVAAGIPPTVDMNPILLKPQGETSQVVVLGRMTSSETAADYWRTERRAQLWPVVAGALDRLRAEFELVIAEGAGSPAEVNLRDRDLVNMRVALHARASVLLVSDIDRGGAFASLLGTWEWLTAEERELARGFVLNKFRGDARLLAPAPKWLEDRTGVPVVGVVPFLPDLRLPEEDAASLRFDRTDAAYVDVAIVWLPHLANFDEFGLLADERVSVRYVSRPEELRAPDLVILPGSKATVPDLMWLHERGLGGRIRWLAEHSTPVLGVCGGYQMLGSEVRDPLRIESDCLRASGLGLLPVATELTDDKRLVNVRGRILATGRGAWRSLGDSEIAGYEMHVGRTERLSDHAPWLRLSDGPEGSASAELPVVGTQVHGLLQSATARQSLLHGLAEARGYQLSADTVVQQDPYELLADVAGAGALRPPGPFVAPLAGSLRTHFRPVPPRGPMRHSTPCGSPNRDRPEALRAYRIAALAPSGRRNTQGERMFSGTCRHHPGREAICLPHRCARCLRQGFTSGGVEVVALPLGAMKSPQA